MREIAESCDAEDAQELWRGSVKHRSADLFSTADDLDQPTLHEASKDFAASDAADGFELRAQHGLAVGDDRKGLKGGLRKSRLGALAFDAREDRAKCGDGEHLATASDALDAEGAVGCGVLLVEGVDGFAHDADGFAATTGDGGAVAAG